MDFAVKVMDQSFIRKENKAAFVLTERKVLSRLAHPNIVKFYCSFRVRVCVEFRVGRSSVSQSLTLPACLLHLSACNPAGQPELVPRDGALPRRRSIRPHPVRVKPVKRFKRDASVAILGD